MGSLAERRGRARSRPRETFALITLGALVTIAPQLLGGAYPVGVLVIAELSALALGAALWASDGRVRVRGLLLIAFMVALAWTVVQALPLPCTLVRWLAPDSVHALERTHALLGLSAPSRCTLSRDPTNTREEVIKGIAILCAFCAASVLVQLGQRRGVLRNLAVSGTALTLVSLAHALTRATRVFGVYEPVDVHDPPFVAPLLNLNTLGGVLAACWPLATAFAVSSREMRTRVGWLVASTAIAATVLMTRSRGAVGALAVALIAFGVLGLRARTRSGRRSRPLRERVGIAVAIVLALTLTVYGSYAQLQHEFVAGGWDKLQLIAAAWSFALLHPWLGVGRGAFAATFAGAPLNVVKRFVYPENFVVQWAAEWGLPLTAFLLIALLIALVRAGLRARAWESAAAVAACIALAAQNLVDFGSELAGVAVMGAVMLAAAAVERDRDRDRDDSRREADPHPWLSPLTALAALGALATIWLGPSIIHDELGGIEQRLNAAAANEARGQFRAELARGMLAHPSEPDLPILAATDALAHGDRAAGRFINRALELAPSWTTPHAQAATWLWNGGHRSQALLELGVAARGDIYGSRAIVCAIAGRWSEGVAAIASKTGNPVLFLELAAQCPGVGTGALDEALLRYDPRSVSARTRQAQAALAVHNYDQALARAREALELDPGASAAAMAEVEALRRLGRPAEARAAAERALRASPGAVQLRDVELQLLVQAGDRPALQKALAEMRSHANDARDLAHAYLVEGESESALSNPGAAIRAYQQAYDIGGDPEPLRRAAVLAQSLGDSARARRAYAQLCAINPGDSESCTAMTSLAPLPGRVPSSSSPRSPIP